MTKEIKPANEILHAGLTLRVFTEDNHWNFDGTIEDIFDEVLALRLEANPMDYVDAPPIGTTVCCSIAGNGCVYHFRTEFRSASPLPETIWYIRKPKQVERIQQRAYVRVPLALPMQVKLAGAHGSQKDFVDTMLVDLSGGGLCFVSSKATPVPSCIRVRVPNLPGIGTLDADAMVVHCSPIQTQDDAPCWHVGASLVLRHKQQDALIQCICDLQRTYLSRGLRVPNMAAQKKKA